MSIAETPTPHYNEFLYEKSKLEQYGHVSSIGFEEWLKIKGYDK